MNGNDGQHDYPSAIEFMQRTEVAAESDGSAAIVHRSVGPGVDAGKEPSCYQEIEEMSKRFTFRRSGWLLSAATGLFIAAPAGLSAQNFGTGATSPGTPSSDTLGGTVEQELEALYRKNGQAPPALVAPMPPSQQPVPKLFRVQSGRAVAPGGTGQIQQVQAQVPATNPALQEELRKLYASKGQQMPPMTLQDAPNTSMPRGKVAQRIDPSQQPQKKPNLLQRIFGRKKKSQPRRRQPQYQPPQYQPPQYQQPQYQQPQAQAAPPVQSSPPLQRRPLQRNYVPQPQPPVVPNTPAAPPRVEVSRTRPAAPAMTAPADDFFDPFTDVSEAQADNSTGGGNVAGLNLDGAPPAAPTTFEAGSAPEVEFRPIPSDFPVAQQPAPQTLAAPEPAADQPAAFPAPLKTADATPEVPDTTVAEKPTVDQSNPFEEPSGFTAQGEPKMARVAEPKKTQEPAPLPELSADQESKLQLIARREKLRGLKGFCPVALRDGRDLVDAKDEFTSNFEGRTYRFSNAEAKARFEKNPEKYAPAQGGLDVIMLGHTGQRIEGSLDHAVWYKDRLHLFSNQDSLETFIETLGEKEKEAE